MQKPRQTRTNALQVTLGMLAMIAVPAALTLHSVHQSSVRLDIPASASPYGYTVSLLMFIIPSLSIVLWFLPQEGLTVSKHALGWSVGLLFPLGAALDFFFARYFFLFSNPAATLGVKAPALGGPVPLEEYVFYLTGFIVVILLYVWFDEYWLAAYTVPPDSSQRISFERLLRFHPKSLLLAVVLIAAGIIYHFFIAGIHEGFPGYFTFLVLVALLPSSILFPTASPVINWRALSLTMFIILLTSLLWEVTLAVPYGWWNFRARQMIGIRITAWADLPIEEVLLWVTVTYTSIIVYEIVKRWKASGRPARHAFLGQPTSTPRSL